MSNQSATIVQRLWNYCNVLRDDGVSYGDYVEQLTYLLFLKMDDENVQHRKPAPFRRSSWRSLQPRTIWKRTIATFLPNWANAAD
jgi:type I restriction enzyme M protein